MPISPSLQGTKDLDRIIAANKANPTPKRQTTAEKIVELTALRDKLKAEAVDRELRIKISAAKATLTMQGIKPKAAGSPEPVEKRSLIPDTAPATPPANLASDELVMKLIQESNKWKAQRDSFR